ncbi:hypothetical protein EJ08DRAFT_701260 [Tothia fuscella]|uniref:Uncharacterized protein n=1 Tax=Tothia fuscella TaxID=1048955 RepID=A0A9P4TTS1_9PEZI|nr:hypothetical protein EJ08DRAFT_701260 [Tothia fuscella]
MFLRFASSQTQDSRQEQVRRAPLTPSTATPPSVCTQSSSATRRDSGCGDSAKARAILSRVASSPYSPKEPTPPSSPQQHLSPINDKIQRHPALVGAMERRWTAPQEVGKFWSTNQQGAGYVSFPDFEKYFPSYEDVLEEQHRREGISAQ